MKTLLDVHTHTIASGHAYSSLQEMTLAAKEKGLEILGITEHGPNIPGTCDPIYFRNLHCVPRQLYGIKLMLGAELNILNTQGDIDLDEDYWRILDIRIAGIHSLCWKGGTKEENTQGVINAMRNRADYLPSWRWNGRTGFRGADEDFKGNPYLAGNQQSFHGSHPSQDSGYPQ